MTDLEKCDQLQSTVSSTTPDLDVSTLCSFNCQSPTSTVTLSSPGDANNCTKSEGGLKANLTVLGSFVALFCTFGQINAFGTYQSWYSSHQLQRMSPSAISWIGSLQLWVLFFLGGFIGRFFDSHGPSGLMVCGTTLYLLSAICTSFSTGYQDYLLSQGVLFGVSVAFLFYPSIASVSTHFTRYRATAVGIATAGTSTGGVIYPIILRYLFTKVGFPWAVRICGISSTILCAGATLLVTRRPAQHCKSTPIFDVKTFKDTRFVFLTAGSCIISLGLFIPFFYIVDYAEFVLKKSHPSFVLAAMNAGGILGRVAPAYLSDAIGRFNLLIPSAFLSGLSCLVVWKFSYVLSSILGFAVAYGFFSGAFISVINPCVAQISEVHEIGTRIGMLYTVISFPSLLGGPLAGALLTQDHGSYDGVILLSGTTIVTGSFLILCSKFSIDRRILTKV
ncbi:hypothetical protein AX14_007356 [Amanita brunnescens Koide BX004]|nr:hypothetical protein AX14_007356 [Amanita brunnescens Koide BX004]